MFNLDVKEHEELAGVNLVNTCDVIMELNGAWKLAIKRSLDSK